MELTATLVCATFSHRGGGRMGERDEELDVEKVDNCGCVTTYRVREAEHPEDPDCDMKCDCGCACGMMWVFDDRR